MHFLLLRLGEQSFFMSGVYLPPAQIVSYGVVSARIVLLLASLVIKWPRYIEISSDPASRYFGRMALFHALAAAPARKIGRVWTTDAPYRETDEQLARHAKAGVLAVEMQAASLLAFSAARRFPVGVVANVTNRVGQTGEQFSKGARAKELDILRRISRAETRFCSSRT